MRTLVSTDHVPQSGQVKLPVGCFAATTFSTSLEDGYATFEGQLGPVSRSITAADMADCGKIYTVDFYLQGGDCVSHAFKVGTCAESRRWVPIEEGPQHR